ncbi:MAG: FAD-dependent oxidoreductase, partial [Thermoanaerobaculia bacterium]|nr:FAD-dependent oxidoreductase [Thermoanaerobaculia bacterium]
MSTKLLRIAIIGSGVAGSILARALRRQGHAVTLLERAHHPRFALGESSTPLAAIALERLAERWNLPDLHNLATYERWSKHHPTLRRGLKRGFTFLDHTRSSCQLERILVAASPEDRCADSHWLRSDVDQYLVARAREEGALVLEGLQLDDLAHDEPTGRWRWSGRIGLQGNSSETRSDCVDIVIDGSGAAGWLPRQLGIAPT